MAEQHITTIQEYNDTCGFKTMHPQVAFVQYDGSEKKHLPAGVRYVYDFYSLWLKETKGCVLNYGRTQYDYDCETIVSMAPGQEVEVSRDPAARPKCIGILFHPDFIHGTSLAKKMRDYSFFSYASNEALHLSEDEVLVVKNCMHIIEIELQHPIDKFSRRLIITNLELLLDYCLRFYERQFITRQDMNITAISRFEELLDEYIHSGKTAQEGIPTVKYFADRICLSPNYFGDMVKAETGKTAQEYIALRLYEYAKRQLRNSSLTIKEIAVLTGFQHPQHFVRFFKKHAGVTPTEFRQMVG